MSAPWCRAKARSRRSFGGERRDRQHHVGDVHALAVRQPAADHHLGVEIFGAAADDAEAELAVVEQQRRTLAGGVDDLGMRQAHAMLVARRLVEVEPQPRAVLEHHVAGGEGADPELRALQVGEHADRAADLLLETADRIEAGRVVGVRAVREVQPEHVDAGDEQPLDHLGRGRARPDGGNDAGAPVAAEPAGFGNAHGVQMSAGALPAPSEEATQALSWLFGIAPTCVAAGLPSLNRISVGMPRTA